VKLKITNISDTMPITVAEAKSQLNVSGSSQDTFIGEKVKAATRLVEQKLRMKIAETTIEQYEDSFPSSDELRLAFGPMSEASGTTVHYVKDTSTDDTTYTEWGTSNYNVDDAGVPGNIYPVYGETWPSDVKSVKNAVKVTYKCGYASADDVPDEIKDAVKLAVGFLFYNRGDEGHRQFNKAIDDLIQESVNYGL